MDEQKTEIKKRKQRELKHTWVYTNRDGVELLVSAKDMSEADRNKEYYIKSHLGETEKVILALPAQARNYFRTCNGKNVKHIPISIKEYNESIVHTLAKQILKDRNILPKLMLPSINVKHKELSLIAIQSRMVDILSCNTEVYKSDSSVRLDAEIVYRDFRSSTNTNVLAVEVYVTHRVDSDKRKKLEANNIDTIEIDLSDLASSKELQNEELLTKIRERLTTESKKVYWVNNCTGNYIGNQIRNNIVKLKGLTNEYINENDGYWRVNAKFYLDSTKELKVCEQSELMNIKGYLEEPKCSKCPRFIRADYDLITMEYKVYCNQFNGTQNELYLISSLINNAIYNQSNQGD